MLEYQIKGRPNLIPFHERISENDGHEKEARPVNEGRKELESSLLHTGK